MEMVSGALLASGPAPNEKPVMIFWGAVIVISLIMIAIMMFSSKGKK